MCINSVIEILSLLVQKSSCNTLPRSGVHVTAESSLVSAAGKELCKFGLPCGSSSKYTDNTVERQLLRCQRVIWAQNFKYVKVVKGMEM